MAKRGVGFLFGSSVRRAAAVVASACLIGGGAVGTLALSATRAAADVQGPIDFETYSTGSVNGQNGWSSTGSYDQAVVANSGFPGAPGSFGTQSLRISDAVTSGSFGDQTFSPATTDAAGEPGADAGGFPTGTLQNEFKASFQFASVTPGAEQTGLHMSVSPDRGDGARMSYVRIEDSPGGWNIFFDDYRDVAPLGSDGNLNDGCSTGDNFVETQIATGVSRSVPHTISFAMRLVPGPHNDVVSVLLDGNVIGGGTTWEDYYRYCSESGGGTGGPLADQSRIVRKVLFRESGTAHAGNAGAGFLIDGVTLASAQACTTDCYVDAVNGADGNTGLVGDPLRTIQAGVDAVSPGGTVHVAAGTYSENVTVPKGIDITGAGASTVVEPAVSDPNCGGGGGGSLCTGASNVFLVQHDGVTIDHLTVDGDNPALTSGVTAGGADLDARNGIITDHTLGLFNNLSVHDVTVRNVYLRGIYASSGGTFSFMNDTVDNVQADAASVAMFNFGGSGTMSGNHVTNASDAISANHSSGTTFSNNTVSMSGSGVHTDNAGDGGGTADVISGNTVSSCTAQGFGVFVFVPYLAPTVSNNTVTGCDTGMGAYGSCELGGLNTCPGATVPTDLFTGNHVTTTSGGKGLDVETTTLGGFGDADVSVNANHNVISGPGHSVFVEEATGKVATTAANRNSLASLDNTGTSVVNATCNWWGHASGPVAGQVTGPATTTPFLSSTDLSGPCPASAPNAPTKAAAVPYNDHGAKVVWTQPMNNGGAPITGYIVTPFLHGVAQTPHTFNTTNTAVFITGLTDPQPYTFQVRAKNAVGVSGPSNMTKAMISGAPGQPGPPSVQVVTAGLKLTFLRPMADGAPITSYLARCASSNGGVTRTATAAAQPITVTGVTHGKHYTCTVDATNSRGTGPMSDPSAVVTP